MKIDVGRFRNAFFQEAREHADSIESALLKFDVPPADPELLNEIFRAAHSIKGASGTFALDDVTRFTHAMEELLDRMRQKKLDPTAEHMQLLLHACDILRALLAAAESGQSAPEGLDAMIAGLTAAQRSEFAAEGPHQVRQSDAPGHAGPKKYRIRFVPSPAIFLEGMDPLLVLRELGELGTVENVLADCSRIPSLAAMEPDVCYLSWTLDLTTDRGRAEIADVFAFVENGAEIAIERQSETPAAVAAATPNAQAACGGVRTHQQAHDSGSIRVATGKVDELINVVGELLIAHSMAVDVVDHFRPERIAELQAALAELGRNTRELQERVMGIRMLPVGTAFARLPRIVHDIANTTGKSIRIETSGEEAELDKTVLEGMVDPLTHLVRNAADHGIEAPGERRAAHKPEQGTIGLHARHESGNFVIEVRDDGRGLDGERIRQKALERGLVSGVEELTEEQLQALIFQPGFSTATVVNEVSGRGVGMDVVRRNVEALGGNVSVRSRSGEGTTVIIRLPLTLAILDGQLVRVGAENYVLPLVSIVESVRPRPEHVHSIAGQGEVVLVRQEPVPVLRLHQLFGVRSSVEDPSRGLVAIVEHEGRRLALLVDELLGQQQVVIKDLQRNFRKIQGTMGATILGDGRISLILDVPGMVELWRQQAPAGSCLPAGDQGGDA